MSPLSSPPTPPTSHAAHHIPDPSQASPLAQFFFLKTVFAILLSLLLIVGGFMGISTMVKEGDPDINVAIANIQTNWGGADPETIENQVTDKLEKELKSMKGLKEMNSASFDGSSIISVEFEAEAPISESLALVRAEVDEAKPDLASKADEPKVEQVSTQDTPVLTVGLYGDIDLAVLSKVSKDIQETLETVPNVRKVDLSGNREEVIHVQLIPARMTTMGVSATQVADAIQQGNQDFPWDQIESDEIGTQLRYYGRFRSLEELRNLPVTRLGEDVGSRVVRLQEVAAVRRDLEREKNRAFLSSAQGNFQTFVNLDLVKVAGSDTVKVIEDAIAALDAAKQNPNLWPYGLDYRVISTDADAISKDLLNVFTNAWQGVLGVFIVLLFALTWREALVAGLAIPLTFLGALAILFLCGFTLNTMVQVGMILALGLLVDVFILMMEGMHDGIFVEGLTFDQAALKTVSTYAVPAFSGQLTTILALAPLMAISGTMGKFIRLIPISAIVCLVLSYFIALFVAIPMSRLLLGNLQVKGEKSRIDRLTEIAAAKFHDWSLAVTIRNKAIAKVWVFGVLALFVTSTILVGTVPGSLFPDSDGRKLSVNIELPSTTTLDTSQKVADDIGETLRNKTYLESVVKLVGQRSRLVQESGIKPSGGNYLVGFSAIFTPFSDRAKPSYDYVDDLRNELNAAIRQYPGASLVVNKEATGTGGDPIQIKLIGTDMSQLRRISGEVQLALRQTAGAVDVRDDLGALRPDLKLRPRRESINFHGLSSDDLALQGRYLLTDNDIGDFPIGGGEEDLEIRLSTRWASRAGGVGGPTRRDELLSMPVFTKNGETVAGSQVLEVEVGEAPLSITHNSAQRTVTVLAKNKDRTVGEIVADIEPKIVSMKRKWESGYDYKFGGELETQGETFSSAGQMAVVALFLVFAVLVIQFSSFTQPFIIMLAIPFAFIGTFLGFFAFQIPISFPAVIGIIALTGIVVNDAIVMIETMNSHREKGMQVREAAARGAADRLRPILTTSITTIVGVIPLALSDPTWFPLASAIGFGLVASTLIALLVIPGLYLLLTPNQAKTKATP
ncbi:efflux RND transporter permease subunit [filamentous cyanobacterium LEGE 11480]|uniref:Efflux RND transporter permease subunit n=1 Tax=Romeriopsis navalis LEGE 11480 TaxID=2777977 RepID=A0A928VJ74_9CYAN|nr:efflux RND transporter permease subunit [Romeriopsis navalis]MBE9029586.1 efflux RND transporter permease subunit [Romeriopsis navalis LEGE 11480]